MAIIRPLPAIRYATAQQSDLSTRIAPPYDVLDERDKRDLLARDPRNFVALDLPHVPPKDAGPPVVYAGAAQTMQDWLRERVLVKDALQSLYVYHQTFRHGGREFTRRMFFARLKLEPFGSGNVFAHEQTFGGPKEDRLALMRATAAQLSPIFGLYEDANNEVAEALQSAAAVEPMAHGTMDEVVNRVWAVSDPGLISGVAAMMHPRAVYIADGHHRYGTSLMYREEVVAARGSLREDDPANFVLCVFCAMDDPGLLILPTHRVLPDAKGVTSSALAADAALAVTGLRAKTPDGATTELAEHGPQAVAMHSGAEQGFFAITPADPDLLDKYEPKKSAAWRKLGVAFLHRYIIDVAITGTSPAEARPSVTYLKSASAAAELARSSGGVAFLLQPTTMEELRAVCQAGDLMPQKSTFFFPKLASGLIVNPLVDK